MLPADPLIPGIAKLGMNVSKENLDMVCSLGFFSGYGVDLQTGNQSTLFKKVYSHEDKRFLLLKNRVRKM